MRVYNVDEIDTWSASNVHLKAFLTRKSVSKIFKNIYIENVCDSESRLM